MAKFGVITVSDTRTLLTDSGGEYLITTLAKAGHNITVRHIVKDDTNQIQAAFANCDAQPLDAILVTGGTGIALRDVTIEALMPKMAKTIPGFGEYFRQLSLAEVGLKALASRAEAGVSAHAHLVYLLPGSPNACQTALEQIILPDLDHLLKELTKNVHPS
ncbi:molybdenum cofactor biosynthesis protein B [Lacticaseibacillus baoqingensis]|uniref:Molybdenum cofactor biosynthesis protein B n=1 Tax=Lacticaseibacillus baoqingensis TaxID=2486013 RepID=A0ABW4EAY9_9LACO|nr:MogA/MoaB family molybdenum cofactor biosynthesis protein [Lacticaseibacillus baoqingensis]